MAEGVYIIGPEQGALKIGKASSPERRLASIQTGHPERLSLFGFYEHPYALRVEQAAHCILGEYRLSGEWFSVPVDAAKKAIEDAIVAIDCGFDPSLFGEKAPTPTLCVGRGVVAGWVGAIKDKHLIGYARQTRLISTEAQRDLLLSAGVADVDIYSDAAGEREYLEAALKDARNGDMLIAVNGSVFGKGSISAQNLAADLSARGIALVFIEGAA